MRGRGRDREEEEEEAWQRQGDKREAERQKEGVRGAALDIAAHLHSLFRKPAG